jgi:hypothetical protein
MREIREDKENSKKVEKTLKKVLTNGRGCGIINESPRERLAREQKAKPENL